MLNMVFNHTSTKHEWFQKAWNGDLKYKNYYIFRKGKGPGIPPNNWQSKSGGSAREYVERYDEWYLHLFDVTQADLNREDSSAFAYSRELNGERITVRADFFDHQAEVHVDRISQDEILLSNVSRTQVKDTLALEPYEVLVLHHAAR